MSNFFLFTVHWVLQSLIRVSYFCKKEERNNWVSHCHIDDVWLSHMTPTIILTSTPIRMYRKCKLQKEARKGTIIWPRFTQIARRMAFCVCGGRQIFKSIHFFCLRWWKGPVECLWYPYICFALTISAILRKIHVQQHLLISFLSTLDGSLCSFQLTSKIHNRLGPSQIFWKKANEVEYCCFWRVIC